MKSEILKLAGVKTEKQFYKKYPTEEAFMKVHSKAFKKVAMGAKMVNDQLIQLTDFSNPPIAQRGEVIPLAKTIGVTNTMGGIPKTPTTLDPYKVPGTKGAGNASGYIQAGVDVVEGISMIKDQKRAVKEAKANSLLTGVQSDAMASQIRQPLKNYYTRPEDVITQPEQLYPSYGVGSNILSAEDGAEIQNTYAPNTIYTDLGYEPLNDSDKLKAFYQGGRIPMAQSGFSSSLNTGGFGDVMQNQGGSEALQNLSNMFINRGRGPSAGSKIGGGIGQAAGTYFGGPVGAAVGKFAGQAIGSMIDQSGKKIERYDDISNANIAGMMGNYIPQQFGNVMEDGGYVSNDWTPQLITKFGEYSMKDLLRPPADADMLRAGGNLRSYTPPSERAMQTYAMGGELQVYRGEAEPISNNPYLPDGGETVMFRGPSHEDGGMPISYGSSPVEVEGGEPAVKLKDGGSGEDNLVVFGNLKINKESAEMLGNPKLKNKKFKNYVNDLSKIEAKQNKIIDKSTDTLDSLDVNTSFDKLKMSALQANLMGGNMKLKNIAMKKQEAAALQGAINDTAEEYGLVADDLAQGKIKQDKGVNKNIAQAGKALSKTNYDFLQGLKARALETNKADDIKTYQQALVNIVPDVVKQVASKYPVTNLGKTKKLQATDPGSFMDGFYGDRTKEVEAGLEQKYKSISDQPSQGAFKTPKTLPGVNFPSKYVSPDTEEEKTSSWLEQGIGAFNQVLPYLRPSDAENLDPRQLMGEMYALSNNQLEPVQAQTYQPQLQTPYDISLQDQLNEITAQTRQAERLAQNNPEALAAIYAQANMAKNQVLGEQMRINQGQRAQTYAGNIGALNQAQMQNLQMYDTQQQRQEAAKSATKATTQEALSSIASKYAQNKLENRELGVMENLYNYRFDKSGRAINMNPLAQWDVSGTNSPSQTSAPEGYEYETILKKKKAAATKDARNGSIVKAIKNL